MKLGCSRMKPNSRRSISINCMISAGSDVKNVRPAVHGTGRHNIYRHWPLVFKSRNFFDQCVSGNCKSIRNLIGNCGGRNCGGRTGGVWAGGGVRTGKPRQLKPILFWFWNRKDYRGKFTEIVLFLYLVLKRGYSSVFYFRLGTW